MVSLEVVHNDIEVGQREFVPPGPSDQPLPWRIRLHRVFRKLGSQTVHLCVLQYEVIQFMVIIVKEVSVSRDEVVQLERNGRLKKLELPVPFSQLVSEKQLDDCPTYDHPLLFPQHFLEPFFNLLWY
jgi:hypothetical protein